MKKIASFLIACIISLCWDGQSYAETSTINPNLPAQGAPLASAPVRANFLAAYNDINTIFELLPESFGTVSNVTFTGDGIILSSTPSTAVTTTGTLTATRASATAKSLLGNGTSSSAVPTYETSPVVSGSLTAATIIPTSNSAPTNGLYLPAANNPAISANSAEIMSFSTSTPQTTLNYSNGGAATRFLIQNSNTTASTDADLELNTGTTNAYVLMQQIDGSTPDFNITTGGGDTGGIILNAGAGNIFFQLAGTQYGEISTSGFSTSGLNVTNTNNSMNTVYFSNTGSSGINIEMTGNGSTTPNKYLNVFNGSYRMLNSAYTTVILNLTDAGSLTVPSSIGSAGLISQGTKFTTSGCSVSATTGGAAAGTYTSGTSGTCTVVITINGATGMTAPTGWDCHATDLTTSADALVQKQTASSTTTATISGTTVSGDVVSFSCTGY